MGCGISMVKYILFLFNLLCTICGVLLIVFGSMLITNIQDIGEQQLPIALIVLGGIIVIISFFGCCGAIRESYCMSMTYSVLLFVIMIAQLVLVVYMWLNKDKYVQLMGDVVEKAWNNRTSRANYMDAIQISMQCCGRNSYQDYNYRGEIPRSCCKERSYCDVGNVFRRGCKSTVMEFWDRNSDIIKYAGLIMAAIEFVGFVFACCLANNIRNYKRRSAY